MKRGASLNGAVLVLEQIRIVVRLQGCNAKTSASFENDDSALFKEKRAEDLKKKGLFSLSTPDNE